MLYRLGHEPKTSGLDKKGRGDVPFMIMKLYSLRGLLLLGLLGMAPSLYAGWIVLPDADRIRYSADQREGYASCDEALMALSDRGGIRRLDGIVAYALLLDDTFQAELIAGLERDAPRELKEARESAGNMHNPKMIQLWKPFEKALLATPTITKLNAVLAAYDLTISRSGVEKFEFRNTPTDSRRRFQGLLWLYVTAKPV
jgi:hypothetical protein